MTEPTRQCLTDGCRELVPWPNSRCAQHGSKSGWAKYKLRRPVQSAYYASPHWRARRAQQLREHPYCQWPGCLAPASHADHILPLAAGASVEGRLQSLCVEHHKAKTLADSHEGMKRAAARRRNRG
jgi:hypothetical protein